MITNPFIISGKVIREYFCDREKESEELIRRITNGQNLVLMSPRRMGKTGLINFCYEDERIKNHYYTFFIDILQTNTLSEFILVFGKVIYYTLVPRNKRMARGFLKALVSLKGKFSYDALTGIPSFSIQLGDITHPELTLEEIFEYLDKADLRCIVAIDEFQQIVNYPERNIEAVLRTYIQHSTNCNFIFSGSQRHILQEMFVNTARPFFNSATFINLGPIPQADYVEYIIRLFKERGKKITKENAMKIYERFEGHTAYVQRTCNEAFSSTPSGRECTEEIILEAIDTILNTYSTIFREILSQLPIKQKEVLYAIVAEGHVSEITSAEFIQRHALASASSVQSSVKSLINKEILTRNENIYSLSDRFFELWIKRELYL